MSDAATKSDQPHYREHRARLRGRFLQAGPDALADYEMLELILFMVIPRQDVKPLAKSLLLRFGDLPGVFNATVGELESVNGLGETSAAAFKIIQAMNHRVLRTEIFKKPVLSTWSRLVDYVTATMAHERKEHFRLLFLNKKNELIGDEIQTSGTVDHTPAYPREIMKRALELGATALILVHNHPSGDPTPSQADIDMTRTIQAAGAPFSIAIHDHLIVSKHGTSSFRTMGLL